MRTAKTLIRLGRFVGFVMRWFNYINFLSQIYSSRNWIFKTATDNIESKMKRMKKYLQENLQKIVILPFEMCCLLTWIYFRVCEILVPVKQVK